MTRSVNARRRAARERHRDAARARMRRLTPLRINVVIGPLAGFPTLAELRAAGEDVGEVVTDLWMRRAFAWRDWKPVVRMVEHHGRPRR